MVRILKIVKIFLVLFFCVLLVSAFGFSKTPEATYKEIAKKAEKKDWGGVYDSFDQKSKKTLDSSLRIAYPFMFPGSQENVSKMSGRELYIRIAQSESEMQGVDQFDPGDVVMRFEQNGNEAIIHGQHKNGTSFQMPMVLEEGEWKLSLLEVEVDGGAAADSMAGLEVNQMQAAIIQEIAGQIYSGPKTQTDEPNFISVDGQIMPNPAKFGSPTFENDDEPNFISVNGQVIPNPRKKAK